MAGVKPFMIRKQSEKETKPCDKENSMAWTKEVIKTVCNVSEYGINYQWFHIYNRLVEIMVGAIS